MLRVIDNFLDDPYCFRSAGQKLYNETSRDNVRDDNWPGLRSSFSESLTKIYVSKAESVLGVKLDVDAESKGPHFQWVDETWISGLWHTDLEHYTILTFLNIDAPPNTGIEIGDNTLKMSNGRKCGDYINNFASVKNSFYRSSRNYYQRYRFKRELDKYNDSPYFKNTCTVSNKFNRTVIFNQYQLHKAQNFFGKGKDARFTIIAFCNSPQPLK